MASANIFLSEEKFLCSICLNVFAEPVSTPCGHNYCRACITEYWALKDLSQCPLCKVDFYKVPELRVNTEFRDMLELFKMMKVGDDSSSPPGPGEVPCDVCHRVKAVKSCLVCLASYCSVHLQPHDAVQALKWHKLIDPVATLEDRVCKKHNKVMEFFCRKDLGSVCVTCLREDHAMHEAVSLEEELTGRKTKVKEISRQVSHALNEKCIMVDRIQDSLVQGRQEVEKTKAEADKAFAAMVASFKTKKMKLIEKLEEKQKAAEQQGDALIKKLQLEIAEHNRTRTKLEELSKTEDDFSLLRGLPSFVVLSNTKHCFTVKHLRHGETVKAAMAKMEEMLNEQMENIIREVELVEHEETIEEAVSEFDDELGKIQKQYAINVTLDPDTAHPSLIVSGDGKQVRDGSTKRNVPDNPTRFDCHHFVLGNGGFSAGKFYYEVLLNGQSGWEVGVARESISRKGDNLSLSPENGCWTLGLYWGCCQANTNPPVVLSWHEEYQKVGVFVDYEGGLVSFYNVDTRALIYSFTRCAFTASVPFLRNLLAIRYYTGTQAKTKIYPIFRPSTDEGSDSASLKITPIFNYL